MSASTERNLRWQGAKGGLFETGRITASSIAKEALDRIGQLYAVEQTINGLSSDQRLHQRQRGRLLGPCPPQVL
jgi:hypothetical protein